MVWANTDLRITDEQIFATACWVRRRGGGWGVLWFFFLLRMFSALDYRSHSRSARANSIRVYGYGPFPRVLSSRSVGQCDYAIVTRIAWIGWRNDDWWPKVSPQIRQCNVKPIFPQCRTHIVCCTVLCEKFRSKPSSLGFRVFLPIRRWRWFRR